MAKSLCHIMSFNAICENKILAKISESTVYSFDLPFRQLTGVGAKALLPTGGFYIFPDFEVIRESLKKRGVTTSEELVQTMFDESSVSVSYGQVY